MRCAHCGSIDVLFEDNVACDDDEINAFCERWFCLTCARYFVVVIVPDVPLWWFDDLPDGDTFFDV